MNARELEFLRRTSVPRLLHELSEDSIRRGLAKLAQRGHGRVGMAHATLLRNLDYEGTGLSVLAARAGVTKQAITRIARDLHERGYVNIARDPNDARGRIVTFSRRGVSLLTETARVSREVEDEYAALLGSNTLERLRSILMRLAMARRTKKVLRTAKTAK